jgi:hypothetical protein
VVRYTLSRDAVRNLSLEPDEQRRALGGGVVTDELALDLENAVRSLGAAANVGPIDLPPEVLRGVHRLNAQFAATPPRDPAWVDESLERHALWAEAGRVAPLLSS